MITTIALLKARDGLSRDEFIDYYEKHHVPLILSIAPSPDHYAATTCQRPANAASPPTST
ncbi:EthD domain-containing protein [Amycolatopsis mediterranei]|uniref:EthD domain-containing protein n=1 Tax=Amycolatopsis mediterranei TaxID=33910 RepID=UPI00341A7AF4